MPYSKNDYPQSMKNLDDIVLIKAIDILNAMLAEGYDENAAIPIAISQAKEWKDDASEEEINTLKHKDIKDHDEKEKDHLQDANVKVYFDKEKQEWAAKSVGAQRVSEYFDSKEKAKEKAQSIADNKGSKVIIED